MEVERKERVASEAEEREENCSAVAARPCKCVNYWEGGGKASGPLARRHASCKHGGEDGGRARAVECKARQILKLWGEHP